MSEQLAQLEKKGTSNKTIPFIVFPVRNANTGASLCDAFVVSNSLETTRQTYNATIAQTISFIKTSEFVQDVAIRSGGGFTYYYTDITVSQSGKYLVNGVEYHYNAGDVISSLTSQFTYLIMYLG